MGLALETAVIDRASINDRCRKNLTSMKTLGSFLLMLSTTWSFAIGLHTLACLIPRSSHLSSFFRWMRNLPLPSDAKDFSVDWPMLLGVIGMMTGVVVVGWAKRTERIRREQSEA